MSSQKKIPGLIAKKNKNGTARLYWEANKQARELGYAPLNIRIHAETEFEAEFYALRYQAEMLEWIARKQGLYQITTGLNIAQLFREYRDRAESPFNCNIKSNTRATYSNDLDRIERDIGDTLIEQINLALIRRWYNVARGGAKGPHIHWAYRIIEMLRRVMRFGVTAEIEGCARVHAILSNTQFENPPARERSMLREEAEKFIAAALAAGRPSLALATAMQFECGFRQKDCIGEWLPVGPGGPTSNFVLNRNEWSGGLCWAHIDDDFNVFKRTTKTGETVAHDLKLAPMSLAILKAVPEADRIGPLVIDERTGRPYAARCYSPQWRAIADAAGLPKDVRSMDARSGAATEADEAGADLGDVRTTLGHTDAKTTMRYMRGQKLAQTRRVAQLRLSLKNGG